MGFYKDNIGTIWSIEDKGKFSTAHITCARKDKDTGEFKQEFNGFVTLSGTAYEKGKTLQIPKDKGVIIRFGNGNVITNYVAEKNTTYTNYKLYSFHTVKWDRNAGKWVDDEDEKTTAKGKKTTRTQPKQVETEDDDELPFEVD